MPGARGDSITRTRGILCSAVRCCSDARARRGVDSHSQLAARFCVDHGDHASSRRTCSTSQVSAAQAHREPTKHAVPSRKRRPQGALRKLETHTGRWLRSRPRATHALPRGAVMLPGRAPMRHAATRATSLDRSNSIPPRRALRARRSHAATRPCAPRGAAPTRHCPSPTGPFLAIAPSLATRRAPSSVRAWRRPCAPCGQPRPTFRLRPRSRPSPCTARPR
jgi:hypothetical protein